jgi:hypothetical protein
MNIRRMTTVSICLALLLSVVERAAEANSITPQHSNVSSFEQELINIQKAFQDAQERGDTEYVENAVSDDFMSVETNGNSTGKKEFVRDVHPPEHPGPSPILYDFNVVKLDEDCAIVTYQAVFPGSQLEHYQHLSDIWGKQAGQWKLKFQQGTLNLWSAHDLD